MESRSTLQPGADTVRVVCPECGKTPEKCIPVDLNNGFVRKDMACCHGIGSVMIHRATGRIVDAHYRKTDAADGAGPAYIPLVFAAPAKANARERVTGWLRETLPGDPDGACATVATPTGFWVKIKQCLSRFCN